MTDLDPGADLRERIDRATSDLLAPDGLTEAVLTDGRRLRRRRRTLAFATGAAAASVVAALVVVNLGGSAPSTGPELATQPPAKAKSSDSPSPAGGEPSAWNGEGNPFPEPPPGWWDAPGNELLAHLQDALPDGVTVSDSEPRTGAVAATLESPTGPGGFEMIPYPPVPDRIPDPVTTTDAAGNEHTAVFAKGQSYRSRITCGRAARYTDTCEEFTNSDGVVIGRVDTILQDGTITFYEATLLGPDDGLVYLSVWNATDEKPGPDTPQSAPVPPLTLVQLRDLVQDPAWTSYQP